MTNVNFDLLLETNCMYQMNMGTLKVKTNFAFMNLIHLSMTIIREY
jgi:hypothetical protein